MGGYILYFGLVLFLFVMALVILRQAREKKELSVDPYWLCLIMAGIMVTGLIGGGILARGLPKTYFAEGEIYVKVMDIGKDYFLVKSMGEADDQAIIYKPENPLPLAIKPNQYFFLKDNKYYIYVPSISAQSIPVK